MCLAQHASQATAALPFAMRHTQTAPLQSHNHKFAGLPSETAKCDACLMSRVSTVLGWVVYVASAVGRHT